MPDLRRIVEAGGEVSTSNHGDRPGIGTHYEIWLLSLNGFTNFEALRAATIQGAKKINADSLIGSIKRGKLADFVVLNADPLIDIRSTSDIDFVVKGGTAFDKDLNEIFH